MTSAAARSLGLSLALSLALTAAPALAQTDGGTARSAAQHGAHGEQGQRGERGERGGHHGMHAGMQAGMGQGPMGYGMAQQLFNPRLLDSVGATAEQKAQLRQIMDSARTDMKALHDSGSHLREQTRALLTQPNVDARAAEALRQQMLAQHDQVTRRMMQATLDASRVLTPEQRQQLATRVAERDANRQQMRQQMRDMTPEQRRQHMMERRGTAAPN
jgi:Spy/CpxP family protein refolding chaperone